MTGMRGWGLPEQHLALDAIVAFVDGELTAGARDRAVSHLAHCPACSDEASTQRQARSAVRSGETPSISTDLLHTLQTIPQHTELPAQPEGLALSEHGQLVTSSRAGSSTPLGTGAQRSGSPLPGVISPFAGKVAATAVPPPTMKQPADNSDSGATAADQQSHDARRRTRHGAGVVFSGIMLGALALINLPGDEQQDLTPQRASLPGGADRLPVTAQFPSSSPRTGTSPTHAPMATPNSRPGTGTSSSPAPTPADRNDVPTSPEQNAPHTARVPAHHP